MASGSSKRSVRYGDAVFESTVLQWANESDSDVSSSDCDSEEEAEECVHPNRNEEIENMEEDILSASEDEALESDDQDLEEIIENRNSQGMKGKNGYEWKIDAPAQTKILCHNSIRFTPGPKQRNRIISFIDAWNVFLTREILEEVVACTNKEAKRQYSDKGKEWKNVEVDEMNAFLGLLLLAGVEKQWDSPIRELFLNKCSNPMYRATMTVNRFENIRRFIRFDDKRTRAARLGTDKLAPIRYIWDLFLKQCKTVMIPKANVTIDEQLLGFRGRCSFIQYMPSKPCKYGIKFFWLCESETGYAIDGIIYIGKQPGAEVQRRLGETVVTTLITSIKNSSRNLTCDNYFTTIDLFQNLLKVGITAVGTLRKDKREIPIEFKASKDRQVSSSLFGFSENLTLVSYVPKKNKSVILLSTLHHDSAVNEDSIKKKPEIIEFYNKTKGGVDHMDQMVTNYTCKRQTRRWPFAVFSNMLDIGAVNAFFLYITEHPDFEARKKHRRRIFIQNLSEALILPYMTRRSQNPFLHKRTVEAIKIFIEIPEKQQEEPPTKKRRCHICPSKLGRMSKQICNKCKNNVCKEHSVMICSSCH